MDLSIIIVNYNLTQEVINCIRSMHTSITGLDYEIIVVDNNSTEKSALEFEAMVKDGQFSNVTFYKLDENKGFGTGCNYGAERAKSEIICFLNPDTILEENIFGDLIGYLKSNDKIAAVSPSSTEKKILNFSAGIFPGIILEILNIIYLGRYIEAFYIHFRTILSKKKPFKVDWLLGASIIIKKTILDKLNGFDERYFLYFEEMDLFYRIRKLNYLVYFCPNKKIHHIGSVSTKKDYSFFTRTFYQSKFQFYKLQYNAFRRPIFIFITYMQIFSQIALWVALIPISKEKSRSKIKGFMQVLSHPNMFGSRNI